MRQIVLPLVLLVLGASCNSRSAKYADGPTCEERQTQLVSVLSGLPDTLLNSPLGVALPTSTLAGAFGQGVVLELDEPNVRVDGVAVNGATQEQRVSAAVARVSELLTAAPPTAAGGPLLYVAASPQLDVRTLNSYLSALPKTVDLRLVFGRPIEGSQPDEELHESVFAGKVLTERDPAKRRAIASEGYDEYSDCATIDSAVASVKTLPDAQRWPELRQRMLSAVPQCPCSEIDPDGLRNLVVAEQRAGSVALGSVTASFLRDLRCRASMPLRSVQQVLNDIADFEAEFSGNWKDGELTFEEVVTNDRLLNYLCNAMPGETLEAVQRDYGSIYVRTASAPQCRAFRFEPVARGAPFGTLLSDEAGAKVAFHYRQGGNEIRIFGPPPDDDSRPTDPGPWGCNKDLKMSEVDDTSIHIEDGGRFYFSKEACDSAPANVASLKGCVFDPNVKAPTPVDAQAAEGTVPSDATQP